MAHLLHWITLCVVFSVSNGLQWSSTGLREDAVIYVCPDDKVALPWNVSKAAGGTTLSIQWFYKGRSQELIAVLSDGQLNVMPAFSGRVELTSSAGIIINHVTDRETGNYSVEVSAIDPNGVHQTLNRKAFVKVGDGLATPDGHLHASQEPVAMFNNATQDWHVVLTCGKFSYPSDPPFDVEWTTPTGQVVSSTQYEDGLFMLFLDNPVSGQSYTCDVPRASATCLHSNDPHSMKATAYLDLVVARLSIVEGQQATLVAENHKLKEQLVQLEFEYRQHVHATQNVPIQPQQNYTHMTNQPNDMASQVAQAVQRLDQLENQVDKHLQDVANERISFHATGLNNSYNNVSATLIIPTVVNNQGNAYHPSTGMFVAPRNATYFFIASTAAWRGPSHSDNMELVVDDVRVDYVRMRKVGDVQSGSVQAVVRLQEGGRVWLRSEGMDNRFWPDATSFSGFLISPDP